jgi:hypothetical protein
VAADDAGPPPPVPEGGESIVPASGSEAVIVPATGDGLVVRYYFPVEVELVGDMEDAVVKRVVDRVIRELDRELASRQ